VRNTISARYTHSTATPRGKRARWSITTNGLSSSATSAATMKISATGPAALTMRYKPMIASGRITAWIQRGTTTGSTATGVASGAGAGGSLGSGPCGGGSTPPAPMCSWRSCIAPSMRTRWTVL
jgi:hypothetical protein